MNDALPVVSGGCIGIENGKISFVSDRNSPEMQIAAERIIDADGNIVMPGLINTHAHTAMCIMRGYADDYALNDWLFKKIFPVEGRAHARSSACRRSFGNCGNACKRNNFFFRYVFF